MITTAQRVAVEAANLPFVLTDAEIAKQFNEDGTDRPYVSRSPRVRARQLASIAMEAQAAKIAA